MSHHVLFPAYKKGQGKPPIDRAVWNDLRTVLGEEGTNTLAELVDLFLTDVPCRLREIHRLGGRGNWSKVLKSVNALKGWCETMGACEMASTLRNLQLFVENVEMDQGASADHAEFNRLLAESEEAFSRAASDLLVHSAEY